MARADMVASYNYYGYGRYAYGDARERGRGLMFWRKARAASVPKSEVSAEAAD
jgi:hypothetical protein